MTSLGFLQYSEISEGSAINSNNLTEIEKKRQARHNITVKKRPYVFGSAAEKKKKQLTLLPAAMVIMAVLLPIRTTPLIMKMYRIC